MGRDGPRGAVIRMWVCHCHAVTDGRIRAEVAAGARDADEIGERCRAGTGCGTCLEELRRLCDEARYASTERCLARAS
jgi:bacterioferritin-associated ferredoxin